MGNPEVKYREKAYGKGSIIGEAGEFHSFGFEAETAYADLAEDGEHGGWRLFRRFKMMLHNNTAGIPAAQLKLVLEPEVASIWCEGELEAAVTRDLQQPGVKYMVVDIGGGTVDVSVHERNDNGTLKEIHKASGGAWGGTEFVNFSKHFN
ncbi:HS12B-like protein [Mya arenaria]|uniref:HS12B-like protein n=1 Tax=Mya arenaria TaxID=6604 RepID=A0ABY7GCQ7_MYAAR|nr:HS12B-like protein [Mya arenaria]